MNRPPDNSPNATEPRGIRLAKLRHAAVQKAAQHLLWEPKRRQEIACNLREEAKPFYEQFKDPREVDFLEMRDFANAISAAHNGLTYAEVIHRFLPVLRNQELAIDHDLNPASLPGYQYLEPSIRLYEKPYVPFLWNTMRLLSQAIGHITEVNSSHDSTYFPLLQGYKESPARHREYAYEWCKEMYLGEPTEKQMENFRNANSDPEEIRYAAPLGNAAEGMRLLLARQYAAVANSQRDDWPDAADLARAVIQELDQLLPFAAIDRTKSIRIFGGLNETGMRKGLTPGGPGPSPGEFAGRQVLIEVDNGEGGFTSFSPHLSGQSQHRKHSRQRCAGLIDVEVPGTRDEVEEFLALLSNMGARLQRSRPGAFNSASVLLPVEALIARDTLFRRKRKLRPPSIQDLPMVAQRRIAHSSIARRGPVT